MATGEKDDLKVPFGLRRRCTVTFHSSMNVWFNAIMPATLRCRQMAGVCFAVKLTPVSSSSLSLQV